MSGTSQTQFSTSGQPISSGQPMSVAVPGQPIVPASQPMIPAGQQPMMMAVPQPVPVRYVAGPQGGMVFMPQPTQVAPQPIDRRLLPNHNLVLTTVVTLGCAMLNLTSLIFGIPALLYAVWAYNAKKEGKYSATKFQGYVAAVLSILNLIYTGIVTVLVIGLTIGLYCRDNHYYRGYYNRNPCL